MSASELNKLLPGELVRAWEELSVTVATMPTQDAPWMIACLASFSLAANLIVRRKDHGIVALAPMILRGSALELAGARQLSEPVDLLAGDPDSLAELAHDLIATKRPIVLRRIPFDSPSIAALRTAAKGHAKFRVTLDERWVEPGGGMSSSRRSALRRSRRKAEEFGEISFQLSRPKPNEVDRLLDQAFEVESRSWKGEQGTAVAMVPEMHDFFRHYAVERASRNALCVDFMRIDDTPMAMPVGARWQNRHWLFKIGYDAAYSAGSPGQVLLAESVADVARAGLDSYELLGSRDSWTDAWSRNVQPCAKVTVLPYNGRSFLALGADHWAAARKRLEGRIRGATAAVADRAKSRYVSGANLESALLEQQRYADAGYLTTVGFWNRTSDSPNRVEAEALATAAALPPGSEVSLKLSALRGDGPALDRIFAACREEQLTLHLDALGGDSATPAQDAARRLCEQDPGAAGCTLPSRWARSVGDAEALRGSAVRIRIVKGEIEDGEDLDPFANFAVIAAALAGGDCHVEVATQDARVAREALERLLAADTSCELQVLHGMNANASVKVARSLGVPIRVYVPFGNGRLPYCRSDLRRRPWRAGPLVRDLLRSTPRRAPGS